MKKIITVEVEKLWDVKEIFKNKAEWDSLIGEIAEKMQNLLSFKGKMHNLEQFEKCETLRKELLGKLHMLLFYSHTKPPEDLRVGDTEILKEQFLELFSSFSYICDFVYEELEQEEDIERFSRF
ncbi:MAG: hypothetical protein FWF50_06200 [Defluviitaleaceae bacterium]|nr:hypothetical protein [Defluviitaleaceae bacterium]